MIFRKHSFIRTNLRFVLFLLVLCMITGMNQKGQILGGGLVYMYMAWLIFLGLSVFVHYCGSRGVLLPMSEAGFQFLLYIFALFVFFQKMIGGVGTGSKGIYAIEDSVHMKSVFFTVILALVIIGTAFLIFRRINDQACNLLGLGAAVLVPLMLLAVHFFPPVNHAHIKMFGVLVAGPVLALTPFAVGFFVGKKSFNDIKKHNMRRGPLYLGAWLAVCCLLAVWNNDLGIILLVGGAVGIVILTEIKGRTIKYSLVVGACMLVILLSVCKPSIRARFEQAFTPYHVAYETVSDELWDKLNRHPEELSREERARLNSAENAQKQILRNKGLFTNGWYGGGYGSVTIRDNPERETDYVLQSVGIELGILFLAVLLLLTIGFAGCMYVTTYSAGETPFEVAFMKTATWLFLIPILYIPLSNFGILPLTGICYPFLSSGKAVFCIGYASLAGMVGGMLEKHHNRWMSYIDVDGG